MTAVVFSGACGAQEIHILLRPKDGRTSFHLGEPIEVEAACIDPVSQQYLSPCVAVLKAEASPTARLSADRIDQTTWLDAELGALPPKPRGVCGTISNPLPSQPSQKPDWRAVTLQEPFPVYSGQYKLKAVLAYDWEVSDRFGEPQSHSSSDEIEISLDDNLGWKNRLVNFDKCDYDVALTILPDEDAIAVLRRHLGDCASADWPSSIYQLLHRIVWLKMQVEQPNLYSRMLELEHTQTPPQRVDDPDPPRMKLEQSQSNAADDANRIRQWFREQYRELLLQTGQQLVAKSKAHPELRGDQDFQEDLADSFQNWLDASASLFGGADTYVTHEETINFLKRAGFSQKYVAELLKNQKSDPELGFPEYQH